MKKLILIFLLCLISVSVNAQSKADEYKDFKPCAECFDQWHKPVMSSDGTPIKTDGEGKKAIKRFVGLTVAFVVTLFTYSAYTKLTQTANEITY